MIPPQKKEDRTEIQDYLTTNDSDLLETTFIFIILLVRAGHKDE